MQILFISVIIFLFVLPFGYWRANVNKFSLQWFLAIHLPVPLIITLRIITDIGFEFYTYPIFAGAFFSGQFAGSRINQLFKNRRLLLITSSCLFVDLFRYWVSSEKNR